MKLVISSGHGKYVNGAIGILNEVTEARRVVEQVTKYLKELKQTVVMYHDNTSKTQKDNVNGIVAYHNKQTRDLDVSVHFNAGGNTKDPRGVEVLYFTDGNKALAAKVSAAIAKASGLKDRGAKKREDLGFLKRTEEKAILIEVCFVDSEADVKLYTSKFEEVCEAIAETLSGKQLPKEAPKKEAVKPVDKPSGTKYQVIAGTFLDKKNAENMAAKLKKAGFDSYVK